MQFDQLKRREFITLLGVVAASWPPAASAQQIRIAKLGFVSWLSPTRIEDLRQGLRELGYVEGQNIEIEVHGVDGDRERAQNVIRALIQKGVDILVIRATPAVHIAKEMTKTIPIVMIVTDALATGLVQSLSRPGGNITGVSNTGPDLAAASVSSSSVRSGLASAPWPSSFDQDPNSATFVRETKEAADRVGLKLLVRPLDGPDALNELRFQGMKSDGADAVIVQPIFMGQRVKIVGLARKFSAAGDFGFLAVRRGRRLVDLRR